MSIGNTRSEGNKGINFPWQLKMLLGQECACDQLKQISSNTDQVEFLLSSILTSLQASTDYEAKFVLETCPGEGGPTTRILLEVRIWDQDSQQWVGDPTYYLPGDTTPTTIGVGCTIEYTGPSGISSATTRTPALIRATGSGTISAGARSISVFNAGNAVGSILGVASNILPGEVFEFSAGGENDTLSAFAYDGTGTTLVITSIV
jgi:hypothetical protein